MLKASKEKYLIFCIEIITYFAYRTQVFEMICIDLHDLQFQLSTLLPILKVHLGTQTCMCIMAVIYINLNIILMLDHPSYLGPVVRN